MKAFIQLSFIDFFFRFSAFGVCVVYAFPSSFLRCLCFPFGIFYSRRRSLRPTSTPQSSRMGLLNVINIMIIYDFHKNTEIYDVLSIVFHLLFSNCLRSFLIFLFSFRPGLFVYLFVFVGGCFVFYYFEYYTMQ